MGGVRRSLRPASNLPMPGSWLQFPVRRPKDVTSMGLSYDVLQFHSSIREVRMAATSTDKEFWGEFLELYKQYPCLWRVKSKEYSDKGKRNEAYDVLVDKLHEKDATATRDTVAKKINNFRSCFRKEEKKIEASKRSGASADDVYTPVLWYYDLLLFLKDQETPRASISNIDKVSDEIHVLMFVIIY